LGAILACALSFGGAFTAASPAQAQRAEQGKGNESAEYRQLVQQALDEFSRGNWDEAAGLFAQAHKLSPSARTLRGMGLAAFEGRRYVDALQNLRAALDSTVNPLTAQQRAEVTETLSRAEHYVATLELTADPSDAEVRVNGNVVPEQDGKRALMVDPGEVEVRATAPGYEPEVQQVRLVSGARQQVALRLSPVQAASAANNPLVGGGSEPKPVDRHPGPPFKLLGWLGVGLAGAGVATAIISWRVREDAADFFNKNKCGSSAKKGEQGCRDAENRTHTGDTVILIGGIGAGVFLAAGVTFLVLDATRDESSTAQACAAGPGDLGLSCQLRF
jgi:hypothetical protein